MNNLEMRVLCEGCPKLECKIKNSGSKFGVDFVTFESDKRYIIRDNPNVSWDKIMKERNGFNITYVPKFGKFEIEEFVGYKMMEALFITKDITDLLNSELVCYDIPFNVTRIDSKSLKKELLKCFEEVDGDCYNDNIVYLMFKWKTYYELEEE